jgi:hypothetical protein
MLGKPHIQAEIAITWITPLNTRVDEVPFMTLDNFEIRGESAHIISFSEEIR